MKTKVEESLLRGAAQGLDYIRGISSITHIKRKKMKKPIRRRNHAKFDGTTITKCVGTNPRREGTEGWDDWKLIRSGMTYESFLKRGGSRRRLEENIKRGFVRVNKGHK